MTLEEPLEQCIDPKSPLVIVLVTKKFLSGFYPRKTVIAFKKVALGAWSLIV
jgi:hypothetical protein